MQYEYGMWWAEIPFLIYELLLLAEGRCSAVGMGQWGTEEPREVRIDPDGFGYRKRRGDVIIPSGEPLGCLFPWLLPQCKVTLGRTSHSLWLLCLQGATSGDGKMPTLAKESLTLL